MAMIDIHAHILPGVDDGPKELQEAVQMVRQGYQDGIETIVATPHVLDQVLSRELETTFREKMVELKARVQAEVGRVNLILGSEIYIQPALKFMAQWEFSTLANNGKYMLVELPMISYPEYTEQIFFELALQRITPILSHPERNLFLLGNRDKIYDLVYRGVLIQVNAGSITGVFGEQVRGFSEELLRYGLVHLVGSDAHNSDSRPLILSEARAVTAELVGEGAAEVLFHTNPARVIAGDKIEVLQPISLEKKALGKRLRTWWRGLRRK